MMEPGSARRPRSMRGVMRTRLMTTTPAMRHRNVTSVMAAMARTEPQGLAMTAAERIHSISIPAATPASAPAMMKA